MVGLTAGAELRTRCGEELLRLPGADAPVIHPLASKEGA